MSDYIKREDAINEVVEMVLMFEETLETVIVDRAGWDSVESYVRECLRDVPSADVVKVVRCGECKWYDGFGCRLSDQNENDYCSYGEREDGESE